jgi:ribonucleoside-diphosphate reductase alpha chain
MVAMSAKKSAVQPELSPNAVTVLERRYLKRDQEGKVLETPADMFERVAKTIADAEKSFPQGQKPAELAREFYRMMTSLEFLPNSPTLMNAGRELGQLSACFVLPVGDSMEEIFEAIKQTALIHKSGGGTGFSFSRLRPANDVVMSTKGVSSGPLTFMKVFDSATEAIKQGGTRRGANMGILRVDHPDIMDFIMCKRDQKELTNFNISVGLTEKFMEAVERDEDYEIVNPRSGQVVGKKSARKVFDHIIDLAWTNGEPGIIFLDRLNRDNPTPHVGVIEATNPCGEQPLLPYESCNLGSLNLARMVTAQGELDWDRLGRTVELATRFLDNVIEVNKYPIPQIAEMTRANRKIGLGVMGWADLLILLGIPYDSDEAVALGEKLMKFITDKSRATSRQLAGERGAFPNFKGSIYSGKGRGGPVRNATCTTIAPTGTISIIANCSSGIEPLFAVSYIRQVLDNDKLVEVHPLFEKIARERGFYSKELMKQIAEHGTVQDIDEIPDDIRRVFVTSHDITPEDHIRMQAAFQQHTDNAVSKTVNFCHDASRDEVATVYRLAYQLCCKGVTIYRDGSRDMQVLSVAKEKRSEERVPFESQKTRVKRDRPRALAGTTYQMQTGCGPLYVTINEDQSGLFELFTTMGKAGGCASSQCEAIGRLVSLAWRSGVQARQAVKQLIGITCHKPAGFGDNRVTSCADAVAKAIQTHMAEHGMEELQHAINGGACPECGGAVEHEGGCCVCHACGYSECA